MTQLTTISEFLLSAGCDFRLFDLGRAIRPISAQQFLDYEQGSLPVACPRQQCGWFAALFWNKALSRQQYIWFIKLPVDEQGKLQSAARMQFLQIIVEALGQQMENAEQQQGRLPDNPYNFVPGQQQLADFNAISRQTLALAPSQYFAAANAYLQSPQVMDWQQLALQGLADLAAQHQQSDIASLFEQHFSLLAPQVQQTLLGSFENHAISAALSASLYADCQEQINLQLPLLRALCQSQDTALRAKVVDEFLAAPPDSGALQVIAGRHWDLLQQPSRLDAFINHSLNLGLFAPLFRDLVQLPDLRVFMLALLRRNDHSAQLTAAIDELLKGKV